MKLIGDKLIFALEYDIQDRNELMGYSRVWFGNNYIGSKKELIYIKSYLLDNLKRMGSIGELYVNLSNENNHEKYKILEKKLMNLDDDIIHRYLVSFGTLADDYTIFSYLDESNNICIIWKLHAHEYFEDIDYNDTDVKSFKMPLEAYLRELERFEKIILLDG